MTTVCLNGVDYHLADGPGNHPNMFIYLRLDASVSNHKLIKKFLSLSLPLSPFPLRLS